MDKVLGIIKPDAVYRNLIGKIISKWEQADLKIIDLKVRKLSLEQAKVFYDVHKKLPFFEMLVDYMSSDISVFAILESKDAVNKIRNINGLTNPEKAADGTIRACWGIDTRKNSVHASDSLESAKKEIVFFNTL